MAVHVGILQRRYIELILAGRKTVESRLTKTRQPPFEAVQPGERVYFKESGGPFVAAARAGRVHSFAELTPARVDALRRQFNNAVMGDADYWRAKRTARYATFIELGEVTPVDFGPAYPKSAYKAWFALPDEADPMLEVTLTGGALRNGYVPITARPGFFGDGTFELHLPDGKRIESDRYGHQRIRWRGWRPYFAEERMRPGDRVRFVALGQRRYRVALIAHNDRSHGLIRDGL